MYQMHKKWSWSLGSKITFYIPNPNRDFYIQFTALRWNDIQKEWNLETILSIPGSELIYDIDVEYAEENDVTLESWKSNWETTSLYWTRNFKTDEIPLHTLWNDFEPHYYKGHVWMR